MLIVAAHVILKQGKESEFLKAAQKCIEGTRKEQGNISYTLLANTEDSLKYTFFEEWQSKDALDEHAKTPHFLNFVAAMEGFVAEPLVVNLYKPI